MYLFSSVHIPALSKHWYMQVIWWWRYCCNIWLNYILSHKRVSFNLMLGKCKKVLLLDQIHVLLTIPKLLCYWVRHAVLVSRNSRPSIKSWINQSPTDAPYKCKCLPKGSNLSRRPHFQHPWHMSSSNDYFLTHFIWTHLARHCNHETFKATLWNILDYSAQAKQNSKEIK